MFKSSKQNKWAKIKEEMGIQSQVENGKTIYYVEKDKFLDKYKDTYEIDTAVSDEGEKISVLVRKYDWNKFKLTKASIVFLENSDRGVSFVGIGNLKTHTLEIHPLFPDNQRTIPVANESDLASYKGIYDSEAHEKMPIVHSPTAKMAKHLVPGVDYVRPLGTSHSTFLNIIGKKKGEEDKDFFGFSIVDSGKDEKNDYIKTVQGKKKSAFRLRSNTFNSHAPGKMRIVELKEYPGKKYLKLGQNEVDNYETLENNLLFYTKKDPRIPQNIAAILSNSISQQIVKNKRLKEALFNYKDTDAFS